MERLWAPWRMEYIKNKDKERSCVLCKYAKYPGPKRPFVLSHEKSVMVILNKYPYISGHLMIVPKRHVAQFEDLTPKEGEDLFFAIQKTIKILKRIMKPQGINMGLNLGRSAGAGITRHLHSHLVPRWHGDTNFMPVVGAAKVISESLEETFDRFSPSFQ